jgi:hypothetical protein
MNKTLPIFAILAGLCVFGCTGQESKTQTVAPAPPPPANSFAGSIKNNPNIPPAAKMGLLGNGAGK